MKRLSAFLCGGLFALGLGIGGMTQPTKVIGFLDVAGDWDPSLMFVMGGAVAVSLTTFGRILRRPAALLGEPFAVPAKKTVDARLVGGAALFGIGWGLGGYCPGPAIVSLVTATPAVVVFVVAMVAGVWLANLLLGEA